MNGANSNPDGYPLDDNVIGYKYIIGIASAVIMFDVTIVVFSFYCTRNPPRQNNSTSDDDDHNHPAGDIEAGLDEATLESYPKFRYSEPNGTATVPGTDRVPNGTGTEVQGTGIGPKFWNRG
ncbi:hypothetical protein MKX03_002453 [Papaver bracteatum]|nr:hypothetical protein MKX03_002453 [Papaver bracteatum]